MNEKLNYIFTVLLYLIGGGSAILITLIITPHLNNNLSVDKLDLLGVFFTYFNIGLGITSFSIPNSLVMFKARSKFEYKDIISNSPLYFLIISSFYSLIIFFIDERINFELTLFLILIIWFNCLYTLSNNYYQSIFKKWKSFKITIIYSTSIIIIYFLISGLLNFDLFYLRIVTPIFILSLIGLDFYYPVFKKSYIKIKFPSLVINKHIKNIFFHTLFGILFTQIDKLIVINFFDKQSSINYIFCALYFSPLLVFGLQYNNAFKPVLFKNINNETKAIKLIIAYILSSLMISTIYYFSIEFYLNYVLNDNIFDFKEYSFQICLLFTIFNIYNPFGATLIYFRKEKLLSIITSVGALLTIAIFFTMYYIKLLEFLIPIFIIIHLIYFLILACIGFKKILK